MERPATIGQVYLSRRNLLTLLSKLDRSRDNGDKSACTLLKRDTKNPKYPQTPCDLVFVTAVEDEDYYTDREPGAVHPKDCPRRKDKEHG